jgi:hypothetical protein
MTEPDRRVLDFQRELRDPKAQLTAFIQKHITTGPAVGISDTDYFKLRKRVGAEFAIHPSAVVVVGSSKLGFCLKAKSLKDGEKGKRWLPFDDGSDVDVAIVSSRLFDEYWDEVFSLSGSHAQWATFEGAKTFVTDLFSGWITPGDLPKLPRFSNAEKWSGFFDRLSTERVCGMRTVRGRLYRSWDRLEAYQARMVQECRNDLLKVSKGQK